VGAVAGAAEVMAVFDPTNGNPAAPHGGTFNANRVTMAAGLVAMRLLTQEAFGALERELTDYRSTYLSTPMGDTELEGLIETVAAVLKMERG
jgi:glutamate-1-semialdehyde 2,1-aminomutase